MSTAGNPRRLFVKNLLSLLTGTVVARVLNFGATALIARQLRPVGFGEFSFVLTWFVAFSLIANIGLENFVVREVARAPAGIRAFIGRALVVKGAGLLIGGLACGAIVWRDSSLMAMALWLWLYGQMHAELLFICAIFRGMERMERQTVLISLQSLLMAAGAVLALYLTGNPIWVAAAHGIGAAVTVAVGWLWLAKQGITPRFLWEPRAWGAVAWRNVPFLLAMMGLLLFDRQAVLLIEWLGDRTALGWFNAVYLLILALATLPIIAANTLFPVLARRAHQGEPVTPTVMTALRAVVGLGVGVGALLYVAAPLLVPLLYGSAFAPAAQILQRLALSLPFLYGIVLGNGILQTLDAPHFAATAFAIGLALGLPLSIWLTLEYGYMGSVNGYVLGAVLLAGLMLLGVRRRLMSPPALNEGTLLAR